MSDTTATPNPSQITPQASTPAAQTAKAPFFWGNAAVFENLDKFEQISNPVGEPNFEFQFEDVAPQMQNEEENSDFTPVVPSSDHQSVDEKLPDEAAVPEFSADDFVQNTPVEETIPQDLVIDMEPQTSTEQSAPTFEPEVQEPFSHEQLEPSFEDSSDQSFVETPVVEQYFPEEPIVETENSEENDLADQPFQPMIQEEAIPVVDTDIAEEESQSVDLDADSQENLVMDQDLQAHQQLEQEPVSQQTKLMQKFNNLLTSAKEILRLQRKLQQDPDVFELSGGTTSKSQLSYTISLDQNADIPVLNIKKTELFIDSQEQEEHLLSLTSESPDENLKISIDNEPLYVENIDLIEGNKPVFVSEKLNKFEFFFSDKEKELSEQREKIKIEKEKKAWLNAIFRSF